MAYVSNILGKRVVDSVGQPMGRIVDLAITVEEPFGGDFPPVTLVLVKAGSALLRLRWELIANLNGMGSGSVCLLDEPRARITIGQEKAGEVYLRRDVLDKQIIDIASYRLVRVNDVYLLEDGDQLRAAGVDVSFRGLLRRMHWEGGIVPMARRVGFTMERQHIPWNEVEVMHTEEGGKIQLKVPTDKLSKLHPTDLANVVRQMSHVERVEVIEQLDVETAATMLEELPDEVAADIVESLNNERAADIIQEMDPDEAADVLAEVDSHDRKEEIFSSMDDPEDAADIKHLLSYDEGTAGALMTTNYFTVRQGMTPREILTRLRDEQPDPEALHYLYIEDDDEILTGAISLAEVVISDAETPIQEPEAEELIKVEPEAAADECARLIAKYDLLSLPVVDLNGALLGVVTVDDILDVIAPDEWANRPRVFARPSGNE